MMIYGLNSKELTVKTLSAAARRALAEAEERRKACQPLELPPEVNGRAGPEPTRFGDWEHKGLCLGFLTGGPSASVGQAKSKLLTDL
jgi:hypothetical protein